MAGGRRTLFLDWGGTLARTHQNRTVVDDHGHPLLQPNVPETLARVRADYEACFIVSNQASVSRGVITEAELSRRFTWVNERLGGPFTAWIICPHDDADGCACRKPRPGMFLELAGRHTLDLAASTHVGDSEKDRDAAHAAGIGRFIWAHDFFAW